MQELSLMEGAQRRDFSDVVWQIAEKRSCDEIAIRYDCGHAIRADVWAPSLPKTREYGNMEAERRRFMQHSLFVLTREPGVPKVQITVPEGRCRHCGRGQRQVLICGPLQMDLTERSRNDANKAPASQRRLELPLSSHAFLAAMGQVCGLPENITLPPLMQGPGGSLKPFDGPPLPREGLRQWSRKEVEDDLRGEVMNYVCVATLVLLFVAMECLYLCAVHLNPATPPGSGEGLDGSNGTDGTIAGELSNLSSLFALEMGIANSTWALSALTVAVHKGFGPGEGDIGAGSYFLWSLVLHPLWVLTSAMLAPMFWVLDIIVALPRFLLMHVCLAALRGLIWHPCSWLLTVFAEVVNNSTLLFRGIFVRPTIVLSQVPMMNPMVVAMVLSLLVAALSAPQPPSLSLPSVWSDLPNLEIARGLRKAVSRSRSLGPLVQRLRILWGMRKEGRPKGLRGIPTARGSKDRSHADRYGRERADVPGRPDKVQAGKQDGRTPPSSSPQQSAPACFVCLDRPSRYVLEPCGHRVVCGECAVQLVEAAARNRSMSEATGGAHGSERGGGACPSCGLAITRAMRLFS